MVKRILREIVARCPENKRPMSRNMCMHCKFRGRAWYTNMENKPYKYTIECEFSEEDK